MSTSTYIACEDCKKRLWVGQSSWLYSTRQHMDALAKFLFDHEHTHALIFTYEHNDAVMDYEEVCPDGFTQDNCLVYVAWGAGQVFGVFEDRKEAQANFPDCVVEEHHLNEVKK